MVSGQVRDPSVERAERSLFDVLRDALAWIVLIPVWLWRMTGALRQPRCRFHPTCSSYAVAAVRTHGSARGSVLAARRVGRCHPWNPGGIDPVPPHEQRDAWRRR